MARKPIAPPTDLSELDAVQQAQEEGIVVALLNADGRSPLGFGIRIAGPDSSRASEARDAMTADIVSLEAEPTPAERLAIQNKYLARISIAIDGVASLDKVPLQDTYEDFLKLYTRFRFISKQIDARQGVRADFLPRSADDSSTESSTQSGSDK